MLYRRLMRPSSLMTGICASSSLARIVRVSSSMTPSALLRFASTLRAQRLVGLRLEVLERELLELVLDLAHAQAVGDRRVDVEGLLRDLDAPLLGKVMKRAHVVKPIRELHQDDADVIHHREQHLAEVLRLPLLARGERDRADLRDAFDDVGDLGAEQLVDTLRGGQRVFDHVVEQTGGHGHDVELHVGEKIRHLERVHQVGLAGMAHLPLVLERREHIGPAQQLEIGLRAVAPHFLEERFETNHAGRCLKVGRAGGFTRVNGAILMISGFGGVKAASLP